MGLPASLTFTFQGTAAEFQSSLKGLGELLLIAVLVIYLVLGMLYESFIHPITIMAGLPSAGIGALVMLWACGQDLNLYSFVGIILLIGIVKKNAIMMVDFALELEREQGRRAQEAIFEACLQRFRPIMMTTMAALLGAIPVSIGLGQGGEARSHLESRLSAACSSRSSSRFISLPSSTLCCVAFSDKLNQIERQPWTLSRLRRTASAKRDNNVKNKSLQMSLSKKSEHPLCLAPSFSPIPWAADSASFFASST